MSNAISLDEFRADLPPDAKLWRYMTLPQLLDLIIANRLWHNRLDQFDDPTEGRWTNATLEAIAASHGAHVRDQFIAGEEQFRARSYASCWHQNDNESLEMWRIYALKGQGVAVQTTFERLIGSIGPRNDTDDVLEPIQIRYIDYASDGFPPAFLQTAAFFKQDGFAFENELRLFTWRPRGDGHPVGMYFPANSEDLIQRIVLGPYQDNWLRETTRAVISRIMPSDGVPVEISDSRFDVLRSR